MGKQAAERRLADTEASAFLRALRISPQKLNLVAQSIRGRIRDLGGTVTISSGAGGGTEVEIRVPRVGA